MPFLGGGLRGLEDPLGTGAALGLTGLSRTDSGALTDQTQPFRLEALHFELAPFESVEYKYRLEPGAAVVFSWEATGEVVFDFHAEPDGAEPGYAESFEQGRGLHENGTYLPPFPGIHGWFFENRGAETVFVDLVTSGFYSYAIEYKYGDQLERVPVEAWEGIVR